jgi:peptide/nickel transport system permease protein
VSPYLLGRLLQSLLTLLVVTILVFLSARISGSPENVLLPPDATAEQRAAFARSYGLNQPVHEQYAVWLANLLRGDLGNSLQYRVSVLDLIGRPFVNSLLLAGVAVAIALCLAIPLGVVAATHHRRFADRLASAFAVGGQAMPPFWFGIVLIMVFAIALRMLPASGQSGLASYILPGLAIGYFIAAGSMRLLRSSMLEVLDSEYIKLARAKGLSERRVIWKHALRNSLIPVVTYVGYMFGVIVAASITVELVFNWPGVGRTLYNALLNRDFPVVQAIVLVWASIIVLMNILVDISYSILDPRTRRA